MYLHSKKAILLQQQLSDEQFSGACLTHLPLDVGVVVNFVRVADCLITSWLCRWLALLYIVVMGLLHLVFSTSLTKATLSCMLDAPTTCSTLLPRRGSCGLFLDYVVFPPLNYLMPLQVFLRLFDCTTFLQYQHFRPTYLLKRVVLQPVI